MPRMARFSRDGPDIVFSSDSGDQRKRPTNPQTGSKAGIGTVRVSRETKGRRGKGVTTVTGLPLGREELSALATDLKRLCGSGGAVKDQVIEIQGDHRDALTSALEGMGYRVKRAGG